MEKMKKVKIAIIGLTGQSIFMSLDNFHKDGETKQAQDLFIEPGGKGYNQAIACAKFNCEVHYLTAVGNDEYGKICEQVMKNYNIHTYYKKKTEPTALATIITNDNGDNQVTVFKGASNSLNLEDLNSFKNVIKKCDTLLITNEIPYEVLKEAIIYAHNNNVYVIYNPAPAIYDINSILPYIDILIPNEAEAYSIYNKKIEEIKINTDLKLIITLGSKGCMYIDKHGSKRYNAYPVETVDTTGAGDVFCAGVASQTTFTTTIAQLVNFATVASGLHVKNKYVINAIPSIDRIDKILDSSLIKYSIEDE